MGNQLDVAVATHNALREKLKVDFGLEDGEEALIDTLEGCSDFKELAIKVIRLARYEKAQAEACEALAAEMVARAKRRHEKAEKLRQAVSWAMQQAGEKRIDAPEFTLSIANGPKRLIIIGRASVYSPARFIKTKTTYSWDREAIGNAVDSFDGEAMELAHWNNPEPHITVRSK